jgi:hypothetical protein
MAATQRVIGQPGLQRFITGQYSQSQVLEARLRSEQVVPRLDTGQTSMMPAPPAVAPVVVAARVQSGTVHTTDASPPVVRPLDPVTQPPPEPIPGRPIGGQPGGGGRRQF